ncbi:hypothetical protein ON010_g1200 [Phytophthora cinnamomi]|nr:hypothetical protein ON010_g1200 [Phytophthora cinnamomi]
MVPANPRPRLVVHTSSQYCQRLVDHTTKVMALVELSLCGLGLLRNATAFSDGAVAQAHPIGAQQAVTTIHPSQLTMVNVQLDKTTKQPFLRGYPRDPLYKDSTKPSTPATHDLPEVGTILKMDGLLFVVLPEKRVPRLCVSIGRELRTTPITGEHDGPAAGDGAAVMLKASVRPALTYVRVLGYISAAAILPGVPADLEQLHPR